MDNDNDNEGARIMIYLRATCTEMMPPEDPEDEYPGETEHGWVSTGNPYGSMIWDDPHFAGCEEFANLWDAAEFVAEFPGGVWDLWQGEYQTMDYSTGREREVTLHVQGADGRDHPQRDRIFALAETIQRWADDHRRSMLATR